ncbi:LysR family transcriptional regulator [Solihabitans fulvus]|uniref:LysR family transcriptional regulator n=1 Tax=Solihabitans fulvus TaxID=1892852 RepID=A0A5B2WL79_9PSEU|nr:LysR family transcriptional regulator [Solihabitans fulvus]KAA2252551.1 LysR family transcriptional regulator [Solihabitans fulvus]
MDDPETRELAYFVAVAEELHFGRAAARLGMAQPPLSRAIRQLERRLGVTLLERTSRRVSLTPAGEVLLRESRKALEAVAAAVRRTQRAGRPEQRLIVVMKPGVDGSMMMDILTRYEAELAAVPVDMLVCGIGEQATLLREGRADIGVLHSPYDDLSGFDTETLRVYRSVVVLPRDHRLAERLSVRVADLRDETMPRWPGAPKDGATGPMVRDVSQLMQLIALRRTIAVMPESVCSHLRDDLVAVPVVDAESTTVVIAWPKRSSSPALSAFVRVAAALANRHRLQAVSLN